MYVHCFLYILMDDVKLITHSENIDIHSITYMIYDNDIHNIVK